MRSSQTDLAPRCQPWSQEENVRVANTAVADAWPQANQKPWHGFCICQARSGFGSLACAVSKSLGDDGDSAPEGLRTLLGRGCLKRVEVVELAGA